MDGYNRMRLAVTLGSAFVMKTLIGRRCKRRRIWAHQWLLNRKNSFFNTTLKELEEQDEVRFANFLRMNSTTFQELLALVAPHITHQQTHLRETIPAEERLVITLRFLATGESFRSLQYLFRVSEHSISRIAMETCKAIVLVLQDKYLQDGCFIPIFCCLYMAIMTGMVCAAS